MRPNEPNARAVAARLVGRWLRAGHFPDRLLEQDVAARPFVMEVVFGVARRKRSLEWIVARCAAKPPDDQVLPYLLVGLYQILFMDQVAQYAAVNETVEALKAAHRTSAAGYVNGILRRAIRERAPLRRELESQPLGVRESHPDLLVERWASQFGETRAEGLCRWNNTRPPITLRPNRRLNSVGEYASLLKASGVEAVPHPFAPDEFVDLPHGVRVTELPGYAEGRFSVQDPATSASVRLLDPQPGERVLDACAAPGGKTMMMAERMNDSGEIVAADSQTDRLAVLRENLQRMAIRSATIVQADAARPDFAGVADGRPFDRILLDVPCTNTGVLRRRPDARWRFSEARLTEATRTQSALLDVVAGLLKPGGRLVYSTCSLEPEENERLVEAWLAAHPRFKLLDSRRLFPPETQTDGAYAAAVVLE